MIGRLLPLRTKEKLKPVVLTLIAILVVHVSGFRDWVEESRYGGSAFCTVAGLMFLGLGALHILTNRRSAGNLLIGLFFILLALGALFLVYSKLFGSN